MDGELFFRCLLCDLSGRKREFFDTALGGEVKPHLASPRGMNNVNVNELVTNELVKTPTEAQYLKKPHLNRAVAVLLLVFQEPFLYPQISPITDKASIRTYHPMTWHDDADPV